MKKIIGAFVLCLLCMGNIAQAMSCEDEVRDESRETIKKYLETINAKEPDKTSFGKIISANFISIANCEREALPTPLTERHGWYQGILLIMQYAGLENAAARPTLGSVDASYKRQRKGGR